MKSGPWSSRSLLAAVVVLCLTPSALVALFPALFYRTLETAPYLAFHNAAEFFSVMVALAIFGTAWFSHDQSRDRHALFVGCAFLAVGLLDFLHALSFPGMPDFFTPGSTAKAIYFWLAARFVLALGLLAASRIDPDGAPPHPALSPKNGGEGSSPAPTHLSLSPHPALSPANGGEGSSINTPRPAPAGRGQGEGRGLPRTGNKYLLFAAALGVPALTAMIVLFHPGLLPPVFTEGSGLTHFEIAAEWCIIIVLLLAGGAYGRRYRHYRKRIFLLSITAIIFSIYSEFAFTMYRSAFDSYNLLGHLYKIAAFVIFYGAIFSTSVRQPYLRMAAAVEAFAVSESRYRTLFENANDAIFLIDPMTGRILDCNARAVDLEGRTIAALRDLTVPELYPPEERAAVGEMVREVAASGATAVIGDFHHQRPDGRLIPVEINAARVSIAGRPCILSIVRDLMERRQAETVQWELERRTRFILESIADSVVSLDRDWRYTYLNEKAARTFGRRPEDLIGKHIWTEFPEGIGQPFYHAYHQALAEQRVITLEEYYPPYGRWFENRIYPTLDGISIFFSDVTERKKTELALKESERYNRILFESSAIGLALCRMDGALVDVNEAYARIIGRTVEETLKTTYWEITPGKYAEQEALQLEFLRSTGGYGPYEKEYIHSDGHLVPVRLQGRLIEQKGEQYIWSSVEDISERKRAEGILLSELQVLELISRGVALPQVLEKIVLGIESISHETIASVLLLDPDGLHVHYGAAPNLPEAYNRALEGAAIGPNAGSCGTAAYRRETVIVTDIETDPRWADYRELARTHGLRACWSTPIMTSEGKVLGTFAMYYREPRSPREEDLGLISRATHLAGIAIERRRTEDAAHLSHERLRRFVDANIVGVVIASPTGGVIEANDYYLRMIGYTREEFDQGLVDWRTLTPPEWLPADERAIAELRERGTCTPYEKEYVRRDGSRVSVFLSDTMLPGPEELIAAFALDITARKNAEEELRRLNAELEQRIVNRTFALEQRSAELEESRQALMNLVEDLNRKTEEVEQANTRLQELDRLKSMFIASMSHELRTPLNSIIGFTGIILQGRTGEISAEQRKQLTMVQNSARHLLALINDIIDISKIEAGSVELAVKEFDLAALVREALRSLETTAAGKGLKLAGDGPERLLIASDERRVKQVVLNLIGNAVKFTERGEVAVRLSEVGGRAAVAVRDSGPGIRAADRELLFKAFSRIQVGNRTIKEGTGLGLYLSKRIADLLGGEIMCESEYGKGSTFTFVVPVGPLTPTLSPSGGEG